SGMNSADIAFDRDGGPEHRRKRPQPFQDPSPLLRRGRMRETVRGGRARFDHYRIQPDLVELTVPERADRNYALVPFVRKGLMLPAWRGISPARPKHEKEAPQAVEDGLALVNFDSVYRVRASADHNISARVNRLMK